MEVHIKDSNISGSKLLTPFQHNLLLKSLQADLAEMYRQRIQIMLLADEGKTQTQICRTLGCSPATARHWMYIASSGMAHQWQASPMGRPKAVNQEYLERLKELVNNSPRDYGYTFRRWTANWLIKHLAQEFGVKVSECHIKRLLKQMGLSTKTKPSNLPENQTKNNSSSQLIIVDLKAEKLLNENEILSINFLKFERKL